MLVCTLLSKHAALESSLSFSIHQCSKTKCNALRPHGHFGGRLPNWAAQFRRCAFSGRETWISYIYRYTFKLKVIDGHSARKRCTYTHVAEGRPRTRSIARKRELELTARLAASFSRLQAFRGAIKLTSTVASPRNTCRKQLCEHQPQCQQVNRYPSNTRQAVVDKQQPTR